MINLLGAAIIGLSAPVSPHSVAVLGLWTAAPVVVHVTENISGGGGGGRHLPTRYYFPPNIKSLSYSSRVVILTAIALVEILQ
jgi:hypothetical protein